MKIGVIRHPGTNCFYDTINYFGKENVLKFGIKMIKCLKLIY